MEKRLLLKNGKSKKSKSLFLQKMIKDKKRETRKERRKNGTEVNVN